MLRSFSSVTAGPTVKACDYVPDASDELDVELAECLGNLRPEAQSRLRLFRKARGSYEIEGRRVSLRRMEDDDEEFEEGEIVVSEEGSVALPTPLVTYLEQSAHVAQFMAHNTGPQRKKKDLTFGDARLPDDTDPFTARLMCMRLACDQAEKRQGYYDSQTSPAKSPQRPAVAPASPQRAAAAAQSEKQLADTVYTKPPLQEEPPRSWWELLTSRFMPEPEESEDESRP